MKMYMISLTVGILAGLLYGVLNVRSPAPPVAALIGLLGMLLGEQIVPYGKQFIAHTGLHTQSLTAQDTGSYNESYPVSDRAATSDHSTKNH